MNHRKCCIRLLPFIFLSWMICSCGDKRGNIDKDTVKNPAKLEERVTDDLKKMLQFAADHREKLSDSTLLSYRQLLDSLYGANNYTPLWSEKDHWGRSADSLYSFIENSKQYGLFPSDYHYTLLSY